MPLPDRRQTQFLFLNLGHLYDHLFMLLYTTVVVGLQYEPGFEDSYGFLLTLATASFIAFGAGSLPSGWLGDKWSKHGMMAVFFIGIGLASIATGLATGPWTLAAGLLAIGVFASIYHPVGIAMVADNARQTGKELGINGVFGNVGVALAAVVAGFLTDLIDWRAAFIVPGVISIVTGLAYIVFVRRAPEGHKTAKPKPAIAASAAEVRRVLTIVLIATVFGTLIFNATTVSLPKVFEDRLGGLATTTSAVGSWTFSVFMVAAVAQIIVGHLIDRYPLKPVYMLVVGLQAPIMMLAISATGLGMAGSAAVMMFLIFGTIPIHDTLIARYATAEWRSRVFAVKYLLGLGVAAVAVPMVGWIYDHAGGFATVFSVLAVIAAVEAVCTWFMPARRAEPLPAE